MLTNNEKNILKYLKSDSRASIKELSKKTQIKPSTVYQTINRLKGKGVIEKFTVKLNDDLLHRNFVVYMLVTTSEDIDKSFFRREHIEDVYGVTGEYDILLKMKFRDVGEFNRFIIDFRKNKNIEKTLTMVATTKIKED